MNWAVLSQPFNRVGEHIRTLDEFWVIPIAPSVTIFLEASDHDGMVRNSQHPPCECPLRLAGDRLKSLQLDTLWQENNLPGWHPKREQGFAGTRTQDLNPFEPVMQSPQAV